MDGIGVMIHNLFGRESGAFRDSFGKVILSLRLDEDDNALHFVFGDGTKVRVFDAGQSCCERRYMRTDDDLAFYEGATLIDADVKSAPDEEDEYGDVHEVQFLHINTSKGTFVIANHNEHNGYYGGFALASEKEE